MAKSDLLKEAIADARAVKETALANAKIALQEAFHPRMMKLVSDQIEKELDVDDEMPAEEPALDDVPAEDETQGVDWVDNDISFSVGGQSFDAEIDNAMPDDEEMPQDDMMGDEEAPMPDDMMADDEITDEYNEDLNLEAIIRELESDLDSEDEEPMKKALTTWTSMPLLNQFYVKRKKKLKKKTTLKTNLHQLKK